MLGTYYLDTEQTDDAIQQFKQAYRLDPNDPYHALQLGIAYSIKGNIDIAWEYYEKIINTGPPDIKLLIFMAEKSMDQNRRHTALNFLIAATNSPVESHINQKYKYLALLYTGHVLVLLDSPDEAIKYFKRFFDSDTANKQELCIFAVGELRKISNRLDPPSLELVDELCSVK